MNYFEKNDKCLNQYRYDLYNVEKKEIRDNKIYVENVTAKDNNPIMIVHTVDGNVIRLNSAYRPLEEARKWSQKCFENYEIKRVITIYGLGNGYCIREILSKISHSDVVIIYEPFVEMFDCAINNYDLTDIFSNPQVFLYVGKTAFLDLKEMYQLYVGILNVSYSHELIHPQYERINKDIVEEYYNTIIGYKESVFMSANTVDKLGKLFISNTFYSLKNSRGKSFIWGCKNKFSKDVPAIVVAAGPSLKKNINELKKAKHRAFILASDAAVKTLLDYSIIPDATIMCDPLKEWKDERDECNTIPFICSLDSNKDMISTHKGEVIYYNKITENEIIKRAGCYDCIEDMPLSGSVATIGITLLSMLGFKRIIMVGQDLAYSNDGKSHVDHNDNLQFEKMYTEGVYGDQVLTRPDWENFRKFLEDFFPRFPDIDYIDATEGGALIKGARIMSLSECIDNYCNDEYDFNDMLLKNLRRISDEEADNFVNYVEEFKYKIKEEGTFIKKLLKYLKKTLEMLEKDIEIEGTVEYKNIAELMAHLERSVEVSYLIMYSMKEIHQYVLEVNKVYEDKKTTLLEHYKTYIKMYKGLLDQIPNLIELIDEV